MPLTLESGNKQEGFNELVLIPTASALVQFIKKKKKEKKEPFLYRIEHFPGGSDSKESICNSGDLGSISGLGRLPWRREQLPNPVFLPG